MVDMVEARKRAKKNAAATAAAAPVDLTAPVVSPEPESPSQPKPVLRADTVTAPVAPVPAAAPALAGMPPVMESNHRPSYFPVQPPVVAEVPEFDDEMESASALAPVPMQIAAEDQVDYIQKLFAEELEEEEAGRLAAEIAQQEQLEVLVFQLGTEHYGMDIQLIAEIIRFIEPTEVPNTIAFLDGIISLRGRMVPVINGRKRLGHAPRMPDKKTRIIVLNDNVEYHGILVDSASQVVRLPKKDIEPTPSVVVGVDAEFIKGVCEYKNQLIILLNLERFLQF